MVMPESLQFSFQLVAEGTPAAEAVVEVEETPVLLRCKGCGKETESNNPPFNCGHCGAFDVEVASGDQLLVEEVELESGVTIRRRCPCQAITRIATPPIVSGTSCVIDDGMPSHVCTRVT